MLAPPSYLPTGLEPLEWPGPASYLPHFHFCFPVAAFPSPLPQHILIYFSLSLSSSSPSSTHQFQLSSLSNPNLLQSIWGLSNYPSHPCQDEVHNCCRGTLGQCVCCTGPHAAHKSDRKPPSMWCTFFFRACNPWWKPSLTLISKPVSVTCWQKLRDWTAKTPPTSFAYAPTQNSVTASMTAPTSRAHQMSINSLLLILETAFASVWPLLSHLVMLRSHFYRSPCSGVFSCFNRHRHYCFRSLDQVCYCNCFYTFWNQHNLGCYR